MAFNEINHVSANSDIPYLQVLNRYHDSKMRKLLKTNLFQYKWECGQMKKVDKPLPSLQKILKKKIKKPRVTLFSVIAS